MVEEDFATLVRIEGKIIDFCTDYDAMFTYAIKRGLHIRGLLRTSGWEYLFVYGLDFMLNFASKRMENTHQTYVSHRNIIAT